MSIFPRKPKHGDKVLQSINDAVCQIIDYLPSLQVRGDDKTIRVNSFSYGKTIESISKNTSTASAPTSGGTIVIDEGAAIPARMTNNITQSWQIPYEITIYPNGYGDSDTSTKKDALPLTIGFSAPPPINEPLIAFSSYILEVGGTGEGETA